MFYTVTIPVYNSKQYLVECIESILAQSETDYEILLVDDGSTDGSSEICDHYANQYAERIRIIHKNNSGSLFTRRVCLREARGEYVYCMDSDDVLIDRNALSNIRKTIENTNCDMVIFLVTKDKEKKTPYHPLDFLDKTVFDESNKEQLYKLFLTGTSINSLNNKIYKKDLIDVDGVYEPYTYIINGTDIFQLLPIITKAQKIIYLNQVYYYYRMVEGSIGHSFHPGFFKSIKGNSSRLEEYLKFWGLFYNSEYRKLFNIKRLSGCITAANRIKYCEKKSMAIKYLKEIASDSYFFELYKTEKKRLSFSRRIIACLLNYHYYNIIWLIIKYLTVYRV